MCRSSASVSANSSAEMEPSLGCRDAQMPWGGPHFNDPAISRQPVLDTQTPISIELEMLFPNHIGFLDGGTASLGMHLRKDSDQKKKQI